jgi:hypothetical protein
LEAVQDVALVDVQERVAAVLYATVIEYAVLFAFKSTVGAGGMLTTTVTESDAVTPPAPVQVIVYD